MKTRTLCLGLMLALAGTSAHAQRTQPADNSDTVGAVQISDPVTPVGIDIDLSTLPPAIEWRPGDPIREAAKRQYYPLDAKDPAAPADWMTSPDLLDDLQESWTLQHGDRNDQAAERNRINIDNGNTGVSPGDPVVEVGTNHIMYGINASTGTTFRIYNKTGALVAGPTAFKSLAPAGDPCATSVSDPIIHFDRLANRWFMLEMGGTSSANRLCVYVSKTSDPVTGGWWFYGFPTPALPDYPHCGVWNNAYVCTTNESGAGAKVYAFDRANMLNGATARPAQRFTSVAKLAGYGFQALTPATFMGSTAPPAGSSQILARHNDDEAHAGTGANTTTDYIDLFQLNLDWNTPANSNIATLPRISITEFNSWFRDYSSFATVPQPTSTTARLDPIREVILNSMVYRNMGTYESIVGSFATNQNAARTGTVVDAGIRWFELRKTGTGNWTLQQEGTYSPGDSSTHHLLPTLATDKMGNIGMAYNVTKTTSPTQFASLYYTGRLVTDANGVMTQGENLVATGAAVESSGRWGDYYQITVDPVDDCTFWFVGMYRPTGSWATRASHFKFNNCGGTAPTTYTLSGTITTSTGTALSGVTVSTGSTSATTNSTGAYTLSGLANGTYTVTPTLSGYSFSPVNRSVTVNGANVTGQNFTGTATAPTTYTISGTISTSTGTALSGVTVSTGSVSATTNSSGAYTLSGLANGTYTVTPTLSGYSFSPVNRSVSVSGANVTAQNFTGTLVSTVSERLLNGNFDSITTSTNTAPDGSWSRTAVTGTSFNTLLAGQTNAQSGSAYAYLGVNNSAGQTVESRATLIPAGATEATLAFHTSIVTSETTTSRVYDRLVVELVDASNNTVLQTLVTLSNLNRTTNASTYVQRSYNVVAHKGKNVKIRFRATTDSSLPTTFRVDTVSLRTNG